MYKAIDLLMLSFLICLGSCSAQQTKEPVPVIFDTDMGPDYDDVGAIAMLHAFADKGEAKILAIGASTDYEGVASVINLLNTYFKRPDIPIGIARGKNFILNDARHWTDSILLKYPHAIKSNSEVIDASALYRKVLSQQADNSVTIITVGFSYNIAKLLKSEQDEYSSLNGTELVRKKVKKLVSMAGGFPKGAEYNVNQDAASAKYVFENFPKPVIFSGWEIGVKIKSGLPLINNNSIQNSPVKDVYRICMAQGEPEGRMSWDQTAILVAVRGHEPWYKLHSGKIVIDEKGNNTWSETGSLQNYLVENAPVSEVAKAINELMMHQPK